MKLLQPLVSAACLTGFAAIASAATPLLNLISDQAPLVISVRDMPTLVKNWEQSPWSRTWNDEQVKKFFAPMRAQMKWDEMDEKAKAETGYTVKELLSFASGDALIAVTSMDFNFEDASAYKEAPVLVAIDLGENASKVEKLIVDEQKKKPSDAHTTEDFAGVTVHTEIEGEGDKAQPFVWAMADGVWLFSPAKQSVLAAIDALKKGGVDNAYGSSAQYLGLKEKGGNGQMLFAVNFKVIIPRVQELIMSKSANQPPNPMMNPAAILPALGLDAWQDFYMGIDLSDEHTAFSGGLTFTEQRGLLKIMAYGDGPVARPAFVPAKWVSVTTTKFSLKDMYAALEEMLGAYNPGLLGMGQMYLQKFNQQLGIDIKRDFFGSFGNDLIGGYGRRPGSTEAGAIEDLDQFFAVSLDNVKSFSAALDAFKKAAGPSAEQSITKREYLGTTINTIAMPSPGGAPAKSVSYAVAKNYFFVSVGTPAAVESAIQGLSGGQASFWDRAEVKQAFAQAPTSASSFSYQDTAAFMAGLFGTFGNAANNSRPMPAGDDDVELKAAAGMPVDASAKPDAATLAKYWSDASGYMTRESTGFYFKSSLAHKK